VRGPLRFVKKNESTADPPVFAAQLPIWTAIKSPYNEWICIRHLRCIAIQPRYR
jgi:hypothetical protein